jgi:uncharacterized membrane protein
MSPLALYALLFGIVILVDIPWLYARLDFHKAFFANVQASPLTVRYIPAAIVYLLFAYALLHIAIVPAKSTKDAAMKGAVVGAVLYGFYDATNLATLNGWTWSMALTDTAWGAAAGAIAASLLYHIKK